MQPEKKTWLYLIRFCISRLKPKSVYTLFTILTLAGYVWVLFNLNDPYGSANDRYGFCLFKKTTGIPCPACGSTRSLIEIVHLHPIAGLQTNPLGYIALLFLLIMPVWLCYDLFTRKSTLPVFYQQAEQFIRKKYVASTLIMLVLANWIWNIYKHV